MGRLQGSIAQVNRKASEEGRDEIESKSAIGGETEHASKHPRDDSYACPRRHISLMYSGPSMSLKLRAYWIGHS